MTDATEGEAGAEQMKISPVVALHHQPDGNLQAIAHVAEFIGFPITLYLPWGIAAGNTASPSRYYEHLAASVRGGELPNEVPDGWVELIDQFAAVHFDPLAEMSFDERTKDNIVDGFNLVSFFALRDARCWVGGSPHPINHEYLRVRISDVTAWAWGSIG